MTIFLNTTKPARTKHTILTVVITSNKEKDNYEKRDPKKGYHYPHIEDVGYYVEDATSFFPNRPVIGREAIVAFFASSIDSKSDKISFNTRDVYRELYESV